LTECLPFITFTSEIKIIKTINKTKTNKMKLTDTQRQNQEHAIRVLNKMHYIKGKHELEWLTREYLAKTFRVSTARVSHAFSGQAPLLCNKILSHLIKLDARYNTASQFMQSISENDENIKTALAEPVMASSNLMSSNRKTISSASNSYASKNLLQS
jgi:hypothetical protein